MQDMVWSLQIQILQGEQCAASNILKDLFNNARNPLDLVGTIMDMLGAKASVWADDVNE